jgi:ABC-2 type transport system ATP-binding protein
MSIPTPAIQTQDLGKVFRARAGNVVAVENLNLTVPAGQIFGLLGPNGAGKTTTVRMLCGLVRPSSGSAFIDGFSVTHQPNDVRGRIGLVPEDAGDHKNLSLIEELEYHGALYGLDARTVRERARPLIERLGLSDRANHRLKTFSKGMRRKFHLIRALLHEPRILLLDEPTAGLDPNIVEEVWDLLKSLTSQRQVTVILCSHHLEEVEKLCDRVAIIRQRLLVEGPLAELSGGQRRYRIGLNAEASPFVPMLAALPGVEQAAATESILRLTFTSDGREIMPRVIQRLVEAGAGIIEAGRDGRDLRALYKSTVGNGEPESGVTA